MRTVLPVPPFAGSLVPPAAMHARAPSTASASSAHLAAGSSSSPAEAAAAAGEGSPGSDGARALQARLQLAGTQLIEEERMMRPRPEQVEPLRDFSATMDVSQAHSNEQRAQHRGKSRADHARLDSVAIGR
jgi:hypothetical protein